jgi:hypothetical protein
MSNVNPQSNNLAHTSSKDSDKPGKDDGKPVAPLEEDDEFEDFPVEGGPSSRNIC